MTTHPGPAPILVLAAGQRCGSTLIQRLLCSHPDVMIWGEHAGQLRGLLASSGRLRLWCQSDGQVGRDEYEELGHQAFLANMMPEAARVDDAVRAFVRVLFEESALRLGRSRWGFKEVRYGATEMRGLTRLFPRTKVVHVYRDPRDILRSLDVWERSDSGWNRRDTEIAIDDWVRVAESFLDYDVDCSPAGSVLRVAYEDLIADPVGHSALIGSHLDLSVKAMDLGVFDRKVHTDGPNRERSRTIRDWSDLSVDLRRLLDRHDVQMVSAACGYDLSPCGS